MKFTRIYDPPNGFDDLLLVSDGQALTGIFFHSSKSAKTFFAAHPQTPRPPRENIDPRPPREDVFSSACHWLDIYFSGHQPDFEPPWRIPNLTPFQLTVQTALRAIPWGQTRTYGDIAAEIARIRGIPKLSAQAVGQAVGANPLCLLIPCHRVVGSGGTLGGYGGGLENKKALLHHEDISL